MHRVLKYIGRGAVAKGLRRGDGRASPDSCRGLSRITFQYEGLYFRRRRRGRCLRRLGIVCWAVRRSDGGPIRVKTTAARE